MLRIKLLGELAISLDGQLMTQLPSRKAEGLLIYLAVTKRPHTREALAAFFWNDRPQKQSTANLRSILSNLRRNFADYLLITRQTVEINPSSNVWLDIDEVLSLSQQIEQTSSDFPAHSIETLQALVAYFDGQFLAGFFVRGSRQFETWVGLERERWRRIGENALQEAMGLMRETGRYSQAIEYANQLLSLDPLNETIHREMMRLLILDGRRHAALAHYDHCCHILATELDLPPQAETVALYERIRSATPTSHNLPLPATPFVGRNRAARRLLAMIHNIEMRLITLLGPGGVGKTRLALHCASAAHGRFLHGVFFVQLEMLGVLEPDPKPAATASLLASAIGEAIGFTFRGRQDPVQQLFNHLQALELLLILDSFEHIQHAEPFITALLAHAPHLTLILTSRERLTLPDEQILWLNAFQMDESSENADAMTLFVNSAQRVTRGFTMSDDNRHDVEHICRLTDGLPLAIELAASWVRVLSCYDIAAEIESGLAILSSNLRNVSPRHRSLQTVFEASWALLTDEEQHILRQIPAFASTFDVEAAHAVAGASAAILEGLTDRSILQEDRPVSPHATTQQRRYRIHPLLRQYLVETESPTSDSESRSKHAAYYLALAERTAAQMEGPEQQSAIQIQSMEYDNSRLALRYFIAQQLVEEALRYAAALSLFWRTRGLVAEGRQWHSQTLALPRRQVLPATIGYALNAAAMLASHQSEYESAVQLLDEAVPIWEEAEDQDGTARAYLLLANAKYNQVKREEAQAHYQRALTFFRELGDRRNVAICVSNLGSMLHSAGDLEAAKQLFTEGLDNLKEIGDTRSIAVQTSNLGVIQYDLQNFEAAADLFRESLTLRETLGDIRGVATVRGNLADVLISTGQLEEAASHYRDSLRTFREIDDKRGIFRTFERIARLLRDEGEFESAVLLSAASASFRAEDGVPYLTKNRPHHTALLEDCKAALGGKRYASLWEEGSQLSLEQVWEQTSRFH